MVTDSCTYSHNIYLKSLFLFVFKGPEIITPSLPPRPDLSPKVPPPVRPTPPKANVKTVTENNKEEPTVGSLQTEIRELRMALELLQTRHE